MAQDNLYLGPNSSEHESALICLGRHINALSLCMFSDMHNESEGIELRWKVLRMHINGILQKQLDFMRFIGFNICVEDGYFIVIKLAFNI